MTDRRRHWWQDALVYQVYLRSFADSNGDGIGDLNGVRSRLDYLASLDIDALWLNPCYPSPQRDHGYDVADYFGIHEDYGTLETFDALVAEARERDIRILMDLVPNHCSSEHAWFHEAKAAAPDGPERSRFWIRDGRPDEDGDPYGAPPNNWRAAFGGGAWTRLSPDDRQWYLGTFTPHQPDLDHNNPDVRRMFKEVFEFWFDRGVEGFRVDAISPVGKHPDLPDQPPVAPGIPAVQIPWENPFTVFRPEGHDVWRYFRAEFDDYMERNPGRDVMMVAEAYLTGRPELLAEFARADEFHQVFTFDLMVATWNTPAIEAGLHDILGLAARGIAPCWTLNNHDIQRIVTRLGRTDAHLAQQLAGNSVVQSTADVDVARGQRRARALISLTMMLPGSVYLYQGEEFGLPEVFDIPPERREDPMFTTTDGAELGRDGCRVPLPWTRDAATSFGFSSRPRDARAPAGSWLPQPADWGAYAMVGQDGDEHDTLTIYRELTAARRAHANDQPMLAEVLHLGPGLVTVRRGDLIAVLNVTNHPIAIDLDRPEIAIARPILASEPADMHTPGIVPPDSTIWLLS